MTLFVQIAQALTRWGFAVFRYDKRGVCVPGRICNLAVYTARTQQLLIADAARAYARMIANPLIDPRRTAVLGHSEGTFIAPYLGYRYPLIKRSAQNVTC